MSMKFPRNKTWDKYFKARQTVTEVQRQQKDTLNILRKCNSHKPFFKKWLKDKLLPRDDWREWCQHHGSTWRLLLAFIYEQKCLCGRCGAAPYSKGAGRTSPTGAPGPRQTDFGTDYGIYRRLWRGSGSSVVPGTPQNTGLVSHLQTREPMWKSRFAEKFKHSVEVKQNKAKQEFGCTGVSKRNSLTLLASPPARWHNLGLNLMACDFSHKGKGQWMLGFPSCVECCQRHSFLSCSIQSIKVKAPWLWGGSRSGEWDIRFLEGIRGMQSLLNASRLQQKACSEEKGKASPIDSPNWPMGTCSALWTKPIPPPTSAAGSLTASSGREGAHTANRPESTGKGETTNLNGRPPSQKQERSYKQLIRRIVGSREDIQASQFCQKKEQKAWKTCTHTTARFQNP